MNSLVSPPKVKFLLCFAHIWKSVVGDGDNSVLGIKAQLQRDFLDQYQQEKILSNPTDFSVGSHYSNLCFLFHLFLNKSICIDALIQEWKKKKKKQTCQKQRIKPTI